VTLLRSLVMESLQVLKGMCRCLGADSCDRGWTALQRGTVRGRVAWLRRAAPGLVMDCCTLGTREPNLRVLPSRALACQLHLALIVFTHNNCSGAQPGFLLSSHLAFCDQAVQHLCQPGTAVLVRPQWFLCCCLMWL